jgi:hypothetical protein
MISADALSRKWQIGNKRSIFGFRRADQFTVEALNRCSNAERRHCHGVRGQRWFRHPLSKSAQRRFFSLNPKAKHAT